MGTSRLNGLAEEMKDYNGVDILGSLTGLHPLSEDLVRSILDYKYGRDSLDTVRRIFKEDLGKLIILQQQLDFGFVSTGNLGWWDLFRPFIEHLEGVKPYKSVSHLPVSRHPLTNTFYRKATITDKVASKGKILTEEAKDPFLDLPIALQQFLPPEMKTEGWLSILPGPYYFAYSMDISKGHSKAYSSRDLILDFAEVLIEEIKGLQRVGFSHFLLDESPLTWQQQTGETPIPDNLKTAQEALQDIAKQTSATIFVHTFNGNILWRPPGLGLSILELLLDTRVEGLGIDFFQTPVEELDESCISRSVLIAGLIDATGYSRNTIGEIVPEDSERIFAQARRLVQLEPKALILTPTTRLEMIPRPVADMKLKALGPIIRQLRMEGN